MFGGPGIDIELFIVDGLKQANRTVPVFAPGAVTWASGRLEQKSVTPLPVAHAAESDNSVSVHASANFKVQFLRVGLILD